MTLITRNWIRRVTTTLGGLALGWACASTLVACNDEDSGGSCVTGETQECVCDGGSGAQTCQEDGTWSTCSCDSSGSGSSDSDSSGSGSGGSDSGDSSTTGSSEDASCCLNGQFFDCPDGDAADACFSSFDPGTCSADPSRDDECGDSGSDSGGTGDSGDSCIEAGNSCGANGDCCSFPDGGCVSGVCADYCSSDSECVSGCCAPLESGGYACAPSDFCF